MSENELCWYLGFRTKLDPTKEQAEYFARACGTARLVFNWGLALSVKITFATLSVLHGVVKHAIFAGVYR